MKTKPGKIYALLALSTLSLLLLMQTKRFAMVAGVVSATRLSHPSAGKPVQRKIAPANSTLFEKHKSVAGQNRKEIAEALLNYFRREQVKAELEIEQQRYGKDYWQTELGEKQLVELDQIRATHLAKLTAEMNALLSEMCDGDSGAPLTLIPLFHAEHAGPNVTFLSPESRARMEELIADQSQHGVIDAGPLLEDAQQILTAAEMAQYRQWNAPEKALLRNQLVGFDATENEFNAISQWPGFVNQGNSENGDGQQAELKLAERIGVQRVADLIRLRDPEMQTAVHDLHRLGLPLDQAESLAAFRSQGAGEIQQVWSDPALPSALKEDRVSQLQRAYRAQLAATFKLSFTSLDETDLMP